MHKLIRVSTHTVYRNVMELRVFLNVLIMYYIRRILDYMINSLKMLARALGRHRSLMLATIVCVAESWCYPWWYSARPRALLYII